MLLFIPWPHCVSTNAEDADFLPWTFRVFVSLHITELVWHHVCSHQMHIYHTHMVLWSSQLEALISQPETKLSAMLVSQLATTNSNLPATVVISAGKIDDHLLKVRSQSQEPIVSFSLFPHISRGKVLEILFFEDLVGGWCFGEHLLTFFVHSMERFIDFFFSQLPSFFIIMDRRTQPQTSTCSYYTGGGYFVCERVILMVVGLWIWFLLSNREGTHAVCFTNHRYLYIIHR